MVRTRSAATSQGEMHRQQTLATGHRHHAEKSRCERARARNLARQGSARKEKPDKGVRERGSSRDVLMLQPRNGRKAWMPAHATLSGNRPKPSAILSELGQ